MSACASLDNFYSSRTTYGVAGFPGFCGSQPNDAARFNLFCTIPIINSSVSSACDTLLLSAEDDPSFVMQKLLAMSDTQPEMIRDAGWPIVNRPVERVRTITYTANNLFVVINVTTTGDIGLIVANVTPPGFPGAGFEKDQLYRFDGTTQIRFDNLYNDQNSTFLGYQGGYVQGKSPNDTEWMLYSTTGQQNQILFLVNMTDFTGSFSYDISGSECNVGDGGADAKQWSAFGTGIIRPDNTCTLYGIMEGTNSIYRLKVFTLNMTTKAATLLQNLALTGYRDDFYRDRLDITSDGRYCLFLNGFDGATDTAVVYDNNTATMLSLPRPVAGEEFVSFAAISDDGKYVVGARSNFTDNKCLYLWDMAASSWTWINIGDLGTETTDEFLTCNTDASRIIMQTQDNVGTTFWYVVYNYGQQFAKYTQSQFIGLPASGVTTIVSANADKFFVVTDNYEVRELDIAQMSEYINDSSKPDRVSVVCNNGDVVTFDDASLGAHSSTNTSDGTSLTSVQLAEKEYTVIDLSEQYALPPNGRYVMKKTGVEWVMYINIFNNQFTEDWAKRNTGRQNETQNRYTNGYCDKMVSGVTSFFDPRCICVNREKLLRTLVPPETETQNPKLWGDLLNISRCMSSYCRGLTEDKKEDTFMAFLMETVFLPPCPSTLVICSSTLVLDEGGTVNGNVSVDQSCGNGNTVQDCGECKTGTQCVEGNDGVKKCFLVCGGQGDCDGIGDGSSCTNGVCLPPESGGGGANDDGGGLSTVTIVLIVVGVVVVVVGVGVGIYFGVKGSAAAASTASAGTRTVAPAKVGAAQRVA
jgi:hypothetical protein